MDDNFAVLQFSIEVRYVYHVNVMFNMFLIFLTELSIEAASSSGCPLSRVHF